MKQPLAKIDLKKGSLSKEQIDQFEKTFGMIRLGDNKLNRILSLSQDLARIHRMPLETLWKEHSLLSITNNEKLSPLDKYKKATEWLLSKFTPPKYEETKVPQASQVFKPQKVYVESAAKDNPITKNILEKLNGIEVEEITSAKQIKFPMNYGEAKKIWLLANYKGQAFKSCQGITENNLCCNYWTMDLVSGCPLDCTYCILQCYLANNPITTIYTNIEEILHQVKERVLKEPNRIFRIGSGELSDSLALDGIAEHSRVLVPFFAELPNAFLELKTKTTRIDQLKDLNHNGHTVVAWSLNPQEVITNEEFKSANIIARVLSAKRVIEWGYKVAFHFDPMIFYNNWKEGYRQTIQLLFKHIDPKKIAWISMGTLRFPTQLKDIVQKRFAATQIFAYPFERIAGKYRYPEKIRVLLYKNALDTIKEFDATIPLYLCMETEKIWGSCGLQKVKSNEEVEKIATSMLIR